MKKIGLAGVVLVVTAVLAQAPSITVTSPNGGESWESGTPHPITWMASGLTGLVNIHLYRQGMMAGVIKNDLPAAAGSWTWTVGAIQGGTAAPGDGYKIRVVQRLSGVMDMSDGPFRITSPVPPGPATLAVASPNGGETWRMGTAYEVSWTSTNLTGNVTISLKKSGAAVKTWTSANTGRSYWMCAGVPEGADYRIRVEGGGGAVFDESDRDFGIQSLGVSVRPPLPPSNQARSVEAQVKVSPRLVSFGVNNGAEIANDLLVTLNFKSIGLPSHFRYRINQNWEDWQPLVQGKEPTGYLLIDLCEQTVFFQVKNVYGESNVMSDSIRTSAVRTTRTIGLSEAIRYAQPQGFTFNVIWKDCTGDCARTVLYPDALVLELGYFLKNTEQNAMGGMKADYEIFGGGKKLKAGWEFVSFGMPEFASVGNPDALDAHGGRVSLMPAAGGRDVKLQIRLWRNILSDAVSYSIRTITLKGPCTEDISEAFKQQ
jgi:hypothetical protein